MHVNINENDTKLGYNEKFRKICGMKLKCNKKDTYHKIKIQLGTILEIFYEKMIKQLIFMTIFYISHKSGIKIFFNIIY